ncbi:GDSL esterase/lipase plant-like protein, putative [Medicago truncatula]|uniref:GDSL esterase/lipase plant-like protein, putative n=1 Tax=Medicago truncatula TaxID=3880 RepID=A0A072VJ48_MEDTR|nr:GDSL esterase/lipase plant-like protein, putative [Medicago truncatula]
MSHHLTILYRGLKSNNLKVTVLYRGLKFNNLKGFPSFIESVINQTTTNLIHLQSLGFKRIVVGDLQPLGCLPQATAQTSFQSCNSTFNDLVALHNNLLNQSITRMNQQSKPRITTHSQSSAFSIVSSQCGITLQTV